VSKKSRIETATDSQVVYYPWAVEMARKQQDIFWPAEELGVEEDEQDEDIDSLDFNIF
jgi:ribonucleotide reductase beta subunit family protein with ferritin-like domain